MKSLTFGKRVTLNVPPMHIPIIVAVAVSCFLADPFGEGNDLNGVGLFLWWFMIVLISYVGGEGVAQNLFLPLTRQKRTVLAFCLGPAAGAAAVTVGNTVFILAVTSALDSPARIGPTIMSILPMAYVVAATRYTILFIDEVMQMRRTAEAPPPAEVAPASEPEILKRLPTYLGQDILYFRSRDHYVEFTTSEGTHFELLRFGDALDESVALDGVQIRRGCWVSIPAVQSSSNEGKKLVLVTRDGEKHVVSRTHKAQVKERLRLN